MVETGHVVGLHLGNDQAYLVFPFPFKDEITTKDDIAFPMSAISPCANVYMLLSSHRR